MILLRRNTSLYKDRGENIIKQTYLMIQLPEVLTSRINKKNVNVGATDKVDNIYLFALTLKKNLTLGRQSFYFSTTTVIYFNSF